MKNLKILIITDDAKSSPVALKVVAEIISAQRLSANFYYLTGFDSILKNKEKIVAENHYDLICWAFDWPTIRPLNFSKVLEFIEYALTETDKFSFISYFGLLIGEKEKQDFIFHFLFSECSILEESTKEELKKYMDSKKTLSCKTSKLIENSVCVFSHEYNYLTGNDEARKKCRMIEKTLDDQKIEYSILDPGAYATQVQFPCARLQICVGSKDLGIVKELVKKSKLTFWQTWIQEAAALASYPDPGCIE